MRHSWVGLVTVLCAAAPASADVYRSTVRGSGVVATFAADDGCVETTGELAAVSTSDGTFAIVSAERTDYCAEDGPISWFYLSGGPVSLATSGTASATVTGSIALSPYSGPAGGDATLDLALTFTGTGAVSTQTSHFASGGHGVSLSFSATRQRAATAGGTLAVDGQPGTITGAQLVASTQGELVVVH